MKRFMMMLFTMLMSLAPAQAMGVDAFMDKYIAPVSDAVASLIFIPIKVCGYDVPLIIFWQDFSLQYILKEFLSGDLNTLLIL